MASSKEFVVYVCDLLKSIGPITYRQMMGEYIIYVQGKYVLTIADNEVYLKYTKEVEAELKEVILKSYYEGGPLAYQIRDFEDEDYFSKIVMTTYHHLPLKK